MTAVKPPSEETSRLFAPGPEQTHLGARPGSEDPVHPKSPAPPLSARAPRPRTARIRRPVVLGAAFGAAVVVAGSMAWAFVVQPHLRETAKERRLDAAEDGPAVRVRPPDQIIARPASYDRLPPLDQETLPPPRIGSRERVATDMERPAAAARARQPTTDSSAKAQRHDLNEGALASDLFFSAPARAEPAPKIPPPVPVPTAAAVSPTPKNALLAGTVIPGVLLTAVDTARPGPVTAMVAENVFDSITGRRLALPQGSRLIGRHEGRGLHGDRRAFVIWDRVILPDGRSFDLGEAPGVDDQGAVGLSGRTDRRLGPLAAASLFAGALTTLGEIARGGRADERVVVLERAGDAAALEAAQIGGRLIDRELQVRPSVRIDPGAPLRVLLVRDLVMEP